MNKYTEGFLRALEGGRQRNKYDNDPFFSSIPHFGTHEINGEPIRDNELDDVIEQMRFGWWDTHHQDGGTYQLPCED
jgi:hypothetical protein